LLSNIEPNFKDFPVTNAQEEMNGPVERAKKPGETAVEIALMQKDSMAKMTGSLLATSTEDLDLSANVELFHKKALLTDTVNRQLDDLEFQQVKAYMTCRVAIATKDDFDLTPANRVQTGSETERRARGLFLDEATVGME
jgi:hypothetical protein